ncbi:MAG TPA: hypothetical protein VM099_13830 [Gemmatimonadaceae bacterium]|nr:hypothetical protein [Gemmatimonadaceae bacterium]
MRITRNYTSTVFVTLAAFAAGCDTGLPVGPNSEAPRTPEVIPPPTAPGGSLEITVSTSTEDGVPNPQYTMWVRGKASSIGPNETVVTSGLSAGDYSVALVFNSPNCFLLSSSNIDTEDFGTGRKVATVREGARTQVGFLVACYELRELKAPPEFAVVMGWQIQLAAGGLLHELTSNGHNQQPAWSPDGKRIAFTSDRDGNSEIYVMNADGSNQVRLTNNPSPDESPTWSPEGSRIAFTSSRDLGGSRFAIYTMNAAGGDQIRITSLGAADHSPSWSPDGKRIAFISNRGGVAGIWTIAPDGSESPEGKLLTTDISAGSSLAWSPDGRRIAFVRRDKAAVGSASPGGRDAIFIMNGDGSGAALVNSGFHWATSPTWSPDGRQIAFTAVGDPNTGVCGWVECDPYIEIAGEDGKRYRSVVPASAEQPAWRPQSSSTH